MPQPILTVTLNPALDKSTSVAGIVPDKKLRCPPPHYQPGGGGINVARAIHKLGGEATALYLSGGHVRQFFRELLEQEGVEALPLPMVGSIRESFAVVDTTTNQQYRFNEPGPTVTEAEWRHCLDEIGRMNHLRYVVGSGSLPPGVPDDFYDRLGAVAKQLGARFILDTSGKALCHAADGSGAYLLKPNLLELSALSGNAELEMDEVDDAAKALIARGAAEVIVVSLGAQGALLVTDGFCKHIMAPTVKKRSTVGAGDSMVAGMTLSLARERSLEEVVCFGVACGAAATMNEGTSLCHRDDAERLFEKMKNRFEKV
jgi:6-phosphofructokinase 2